MTIEHSAFEEVQDFMWCVAHDDVAEGDGEIECNSIICDKAFALSFRGGPCVLARLYIGAIISGAS